MKILISKAERAAIADIMKRMAWGGTTDIILAQLALYDLLEVGSAAIVSDEAAVVGDEAPVAASAEEAKTYDLPDEHVGALASILSAGGQRIETALLSGAVLRRMSEDLKSKLKTKSKA